MQTACFTPTAVLTPLRPKDAESTQPLRSNRRARRARTTPAPPLSQNAQRRRARRRPTPSTEAVPEPIVEGALDCEDAAEVLASVLPSTISPVSRDKKMETEPEQLVQMTASDVKRGAQRTQTSTPTLTSRISEILGNAPNDITLKSKYQPTLRTSMTSAGTFHGQHVYASTSSSQFHAVDPERLAVEEERRARRRAQRQETFTYNVQLKEYAQKRNLDACLALLSDMRNRGVRADAYTYSTVLTCCSRLRATETALELYGRMLADRVRVDEHVLITMMGIAGRANPPCLDMLRALFHQSSSPNVVMCNVYMDGLANMGMIEDVEGCLRYMGFRGLKADSYTGTAVAKAYVRAGRVNDAENRVIELQKSGCIDNAGPLNVVMAAYSSAGDIESVRRVFSLLEHRKTLVSYNVLISAYVHTGNIRAAFDVFDSMLHHGHTGDRYTMHSLMKVCIAAGDGAVAFHTYTTFRDSTKWIPNNVSYRTAAQAAAISRDSYALSEVAEDARKYGAVLREDAMAMFVAAALRCDNDDDALAYTREYLSRNSEDQHKPFFKAIENALISLPGPVFEHNTDLDARKVVRNLIRTCNLLNGIGD